MCEIGEIADAAQGGCKTVVIGRTGDFHRAERGKMRGQELGVEQFKPRLPKVIDQKSQCNF